MTDNRKDHDTMNIESTTPEDVVSTAGFLTWPNGVRALCFSAGLPS